MIIRKFQPSSTNSAKKDALSILDAGLGAANPKQYLEKIVKNGKLVLPGRKIDLEKYDRVFVVAVGKAAYSMASEMDLLTRIDGGILVVPSNVRSNEQKIQDNQGRSSNSKQE